MALLRPFPNYFSWSTSNHKQGLFGQNTLYRPYKTSVSLTQPVEAALLHSRVEVTVYMEPLKSHHSSMCVYTFWLISINCFCFKLREQIVRLRGHLYKVMGLICGFP